MVIRNASAYTEDGAFVPRDIHFHGCAGHDFSDGNG